MKKQETQMIKVSQAFTSSGYQQRMLETLHSPKRVQTFTNAIVTAVAQNPMLNQECTPASVLSCALLGESLNLLHSPQAGHYYMVPFSKKGQDKKEATFILGYKGYIQLAKRSGQYKKMNVVSLKEGELISFDPFEEEIKVKRIDDEVEREKAKTVGYYAFFEELNGFRKAIYWSKEKMMIHADKYSPAFNKLNMQKFEQGKIAKEDEWKLSSFWYKDFDSMAHKTMLRQLISKWGTMSIELATALEADEQMIKEDLTPNISSSPEEIEIEDITPTEATEVASQEVGTVIERNQVNIDEI